MSRRSDREGVPRHEAQYRRNLATQAAKERAGINERGWYPPCTVWERFEELAHAAWCIRYRLLICRDYLTPYQRADWIRRARISLERAAQCPRPQLP